jgi:hypothetical protein
MKTFKDTSGNASQRRKISRARVHRSYKQIFEDKECGNGTFHTYHLYVPEDPWSWVDFKFLSLKNPKKYYFAVSMITLTQDAYDTDEELAYQKLDEIDGPYDIVFEMEPCSKEIQKKYGRGCKQYKPNEEAENKLAKRTEIRLSISRVLNAIERDMVPVIKVNTEDYRPGCIGLLMVVDEPFLNAEVIEKYIKLFREIGEPVNDGIVWEGPNVKITPNKESNIQEDSGD